MKHKLTLAAAIASGITTTACSPKSTSLNTDLSSTSNPIALTETQKTLKNECLGFAKSKDRFCNFYALSGGIKNVFAGKIRVINETNQLNVKNGDDCEVKFTFGHLPHPGPFDPKGTTLMLGIYFGQQDLNHLERRTTAPLVH